MIYLVLLKKDMPRLVQDVRAVRVMGRSLSDQHMALCKVRLEEAWRKMREVVDGARRIRSEKLREHLYRERYCRSREGKGVVWDGNNTVGYMWGQVKWAMVESAREVCD